MKNKSNILTVLFAGLFLAFFSCKKEDTRIVPVIAIANVSEITATSITSIQSITTDGGAAITEKGLCWSTNPDPTVADQKITTSGDSTSFTSSITGLMSGTSYSIRAYAKNAEGIGYSNPSTVMTLPAPVISDGYSVTLQKASKGKGIDLVFLGDGYSSEDISSQKYENDLKKAIGYFFAIEPYKSYSAYFNVYMVYAFSGESGISNPNKSVNTKFETKYAAIGSTAMLANEMTCRNYALKAPVLDIDNTLAVLVANSSQYGGTTYLHSAQKGFSVSICPVASDYFRGIVQHEAGGHGFGNLADEYVNYTGLIPQNEIDGLRSIQNNQIYLNVDLTGNTSSILWNHFIGLPNYSYVGAYEGGYYYGQGVWRPEKNSLMINNVSYINAPSRELIVKRIMKLAGMNYSFDDFIAKDVMDLSAVTRSASLFIDNSKILAAPVFIK